MLRTKVSSKGQVSIPKSIRDQLGLARGSEISVTVENESVVLRKVVPAWRRWRGALAGSNLLREHEREHRDEIERDEALKGDA